MEKPPSLFRSLKTWVLLFHGLVAFFFLFGTITPPSFSHKKILVHTKDFKAASPQVKNPSPQKTAPAAKKAAAPQKKESTPEKKSASDKKKAPSPTAAPKVEKKNKPAPVAKKTPEAKPSKENEKNSAALSLLEEMEERIAKFEKNQDKRSERRSIEKSSEKRTSELEWLQTEETANEPDFSEDLIGFLHENLQLPDYGRVKVKLLITSLGVVKSVEILESESKLNSQYLQDHLPGLKFPFINRALFKKEEKSLILNFCNEL